MRELDFDEYGGMARMYAVGEVFAGVEPTRGSNRPKEPQPLWAAASHIHV
jgi:hypothetical protein